MKLITVRTLDLHYGERHILRNLAFSLLTGEMVGITGASGSGKSSLLHCLRGLLSDRAQYDIVLSNIPINNLSEMDLVCRMGLVSQNPQTQLFFETVQDELVFGMENLGVSPAEMEERMDHALGMVGLTCSLSTHPQYLSGGEQQLLALACALCMRPAILLLDECFSMTAPVHRAHVLEQLCAYASMGRGVVMVSHQPDVLAWCDRVFVLDNGVLREECDV